MERVGVVPGTEIGGYRVLGPLGRGGMGDVYRAADGGGAVVALKVLHPQAGPDDEARERLRREVATLQRIRHPAVARVLDAEIESTEAFVVTELVEGEDLGARVRRGGPLPTAAVADLAERLEEALDVVHGAGVLHRDLTPGNVLLSPRGPVLIDFGIAQAVEDARVTSAGLVVGTPGYLSPELLEGAEPTEAGDWWGWAAVVAFAATGRPPFGTRPLQAVLARARAGEPDLQGLDRRTARALRSAMTVDPRHRAAPHEVVAELRRAAAGDTEPGDADPGTVPMAAGAPLGAQGAATQPVPVDDPTRTTLVPHGATAAEARGPADTMTMPAVDAPYADGAYDDGGYADGGYDDGGYDDEPGYGEGYDDAYGAEEGYDADADPDGGAAPGVPAVYLAPQPPRRTGTVLAVGLLLLAVGLSYPGAALVAAVALAVLARGVGVAAGALHVRRSRRGERPADLARVTLGAPWYLLRAVVGVLPAVIVAASVVVVVGGVGWWLLDSGRWVMAAPAPGATAGELEGNAPWVVPAMLGAAVLLGLLALWFGPMARPTRVGARWALGAVAPGRAGALTVVGLALAAAVVLTLRFLGADAPEVAWWPLPGPPDMG